MDLPAHRCPALALEGTDLNLLNSIVEDDERPCVKLLCVKIIANKVLNRRSMQVNRDILENLYRYMKLFGCFTEISMVGLDAINEVMSVKGGSRIVNDVCGNLDTHLKRHEESALMKAKIDLYRRNVMQKMNDAAEILTTFPNSRVN